jgi:hypothetical protein
MDGMLPRTWSDWLAFAWLAGCALGVLVMLAASGQSYPVWREAGFTSAGMFLLGGPVAVLLMAERFLRGVREARGFAWPLALFCLTALPAAGLLIVGELLGLP